MERSAKRLTTTTAVLLLGACFTLACGSDVEEGDPNDGGGSSTGTATGTATGTGTGTGTGSCPTEAPVNFSDCSADQEGLLCEYNTVECDDGGPETSWACESGSWNEYPTGCNVCPDEAPVVGTDCTAWPLANNCSYSVETGCGTQQLQLTCLDGQPPTWDNQVGPPTGCPEGCVAYDSEAGCASDPACRWLVPGCSGSANELSAPGCFDATPCTTGSCGNGETCTTVGHDPCHNLVCAACSAETDVCL